MDFYVPSTGYEFSGSQGFSTKLVIYGDGGYTNQYYASGYHSGCSSLSTYFEASYGTVSVSSETLTLQPAKHEVALTGCGTEKIDLGTDPLELTMTLSNRYYEASGRVYYMNLEGGIHPLDLELLHKDPPEPGYQPPQPADFVVGDTVMFQEFMGLWTPSPNTKTDFYNPSTGEFYFPERDGTANEWLWFGEDKYELASVKWHYLLGQGVCKKREIYWERGDPRFYLADTASDMSFLHFRAEAEVAHLVVEITECGDLDGAVIYDLTPLTTYYMFRYVPDGQYQNENVAFRCGDFEWSEYQYMICGGMSDWWKAERRE